MSTIKGKRQFRKAFSEPEWQGLVELMDSITTAYATHSPVTQSMAERARQYRTMLFE